MFGLRARLWRHAGSLMWLQLFTSADKTEAIEHDDQRTNNVENRRHDWIDVLQRGQSESPNHK